MYLLRAPIKKFGQVPTRSPLMTDEVLFSHNIAFCPKHFWKKHHILQGCIDISPNWMIHERKNRELHRILIIATGGLGDSMWAMPVARYLREKHPRSRILIATDERCMPLWYKVPFADMCVKNEFWNLQSLIRNSDEVYDFGGIATCLKEEMKLDPIEATFKHVELDLPTEKTKLRPKLVVTIDEGKKIEARLTREGVDIAKDKIVVIALESSTPNRNWPFTYSKVLSKALVKEGYKVVWLSHTKDFGDTYFYDCECGWELVSTMKDPPSKLSFECPVCKKEVRINEVRAPDGIINWAGKTDIRETMAIIALADIFIGPNSALMVIATSLLTPSIGLFGAFDPKLRAKFYEKFIGLFGKVQCAPCNEHWTECREGHPAPCMRVITPKEVYDALKTLIEKYPKDPIGRLPME